MQFYQRALSKYSNSSTQKKSYLTIGLTLGLLILLLALIFPAVNHILKLNKEIADGKRVEQQLQEKIDNLIKAESNYTESKDRLAVLDDALPTGSSVDTHLKQLEQLSARNNSRLAGIQFSDVSLSIPTNKQNLSTRDIEYSVTVIGRFSNIISFVSDLEKIVRTVDITSLSVSEDGTTLSAAIKAVTHYLGESSARTAQPGDNTQTNPDSVLEGQ